MFLNPLSLICRTVIPYWISLFVFFLFPFIESSAQNSATIIAKQKQLKQEISLTQKNLQLLKKDKSAGLARYTALRKQVDSRNALIENYQVQVDLIEANLVAQEADITLTKVKHDTQKVRYQEAIRNYYKVRNSYKPISFILSSKDFTTAWKRMIFYRGLSRHHKAELENLTFLEDQLLIYLSELKQSKAEKETVLSDLITQRARLQTSQKSREVELANLKKNEAFLKKRLISQEAQAQKLSALLTKLVEESIKKTAPKNTASTVKLNPAFGSNKGRLPWPVQKGYVGKRFGKQRHPDLKMIYITNNGIDIVTESGSEIMAVFDGTVTAIQTVAGFQNTILINHGGYYTVYANVDNLLVNKGDQVKAGQGIATIAESMDGSSLHFELWKGKTLQNPSKWLRKR